MYWYSQVTRPLRYSINVTLDGCCDHRAIPADEDLHRHAIENLNKADAPIEPPAPADVPTPEDEALEREDREVLTMPSCRHAA